MLTNLSSLILCLMTVQVVAAQSAYLYTNISSDGSSVSVSGVIQSDSWPGSYGAIHTYSQTLRVSSPSGRSQTCSFNDPVLASQGVNLECVADLSSYDANGVFEQGPYYVSGQQQAQCNQVGTFAYTPIKDSIPFRHIKAYYRYTNTANAGLGVYARCNPVGSTCDYCTVTLGPSTWQYGLFDGAEIAIRGNSLCVMAAKQQVNGCLAPDPVPGSGGGVAKFQPNVNSSPRYHGNAEHLIETVSSLGERSIAKASSRLPSN